MEKKNKTLIIIDGIANTQSLTGEKAKVTVGLDEEQMSSLGKKLSLGKILKALDPIITEKFFKLFRPTEEYVIMKKAHDDLENNLNLVYKIRSSIMHEKEKYTLEDLRKEVVNSDRLKNNFISAQNTFFNSSPKEFSIRIKTQKNGK